jgi:hypothetical protein
MDNPSKVRCSVYFDMQSWFRIARTTFDCSLPDFNPMKLAKLFAERNGYELFEVRLYVSDPTEMFGKHWRVLWQNRLADLAAQGCKVFESPVTPRTMYTVRNAEQPLSERVVVYSEHDVALRLCIDATMDVSEQRVDCVVLGTKDRGYVQLVNRLRDYAKSHDKWLKIVTLFPHDGNKSAKGYMGIDRTDWFRVNLNDYLACRDVIRRNGTLAGNTSKQNPTASPNNDRDSGDSHTACVTEHADSNNQNNTTEKAGE